MNTFPTLTRKPTASSFTEEYSDEAVSRSDYASGYPLINSEFTFDPKNFSYTLEYAPDADRTLIENFYASNKALVFNWVHLKTGVTYEVIFKSKPRVSMSKVPDKWHISIDLRQATSEVTAPSGLTGDYLIHPDGRIFVNPDGSYMTLP